MQGAGIEIGKAILLRMAPYIIGRVIKEIDFASIGTMAGTKIRKTLDSIKGKADQSESKIDDVLVGFIEGQLAGMDYPEVLEMMKIILPLAEKVIIASKTKVDDRVLLPVIQEYRKGWGI